MSNQPPNDSAGEVQSQDVLTRYLNEEQDPAAAKRAYTQVTEILTTDEKILYIAVQKPLLLSLSPDCVVLTNKRFIVYRPKLLGGASFQDYIWRDLRDAHLKEGRARATFTLKTMDKKTLRIDDLPKNQARKLYAFAQEREEEVREERRSREMEEKRAGAGGVFLQGSTPTPQAPSVTKEDPLEKLKKLKEMMDFELITEKEYEEKKAEILSKM